VFLDFYMYRQRRAYANVEGPDYMQQRDVHHHHKPPQRETTVSNTVFNGVNSEHKDTCALAAHGKLC